MAGLLRPIVIARRLQSYRLDGWSAGPSPLMIGFDPESMATGPGRVRIQMRPVQSHPEELSEDAEGCAHDRFWPCQELKLRA
jgi:hypothetical protein